MRSPPRAGRSRSERRFQDFSKARNEVEGGVKWQGRSGGYYVSQEKDYFAQQISAVRCATFFEDVTVSAGASYGWDAIEPSGRRRRRDRRIRTRPRCT